MVEARVCKKGEFALEKIRLPRGKWKGQRQDWRADAGWKKRNSPGCRDGWTCCTNRRFIVNSSRIFQVISSVMSEGYGRPSASNRVVTRGEQGRHCQFNIWSPFSLCSFILRLLLMSRFCLYFIVNALRCPSKWIVEGTTFDVQQLSAI